MIKVSMSLVFCITGAMENWGLVTYRETALLIDTNQSSAVSKQTVALVVGHELAHQWFGNLVTMVMNYFYFILSNNEDNLMTEKIRRGKTSCKDGNIKAERKKFGKILEEMEKKSEFFRVAKQIVRNNSDIGGRMVCVRDGRIVVDENKIIDVWRTHYEKLSHEVSVKQGDTQCG